MHGGIHQLVEQHAFTRRSGLGVDTGRPGSQRSAWPDTLSLQPGQVQNGLNLCLHLRSPAQMPALLQGIHALQDEINDALSSLHYVHFARFLPTPDGSALWVITVFDGDLQSYLMDFVKVLGGPFNAMLAFVQDAPRLPVQQYPRDFCEWVNRNNTTQAQPWSAYKDLTCIDIQRVRHYA